ncbi:MAG: hypothetical protein RDU20_23615 [Desulfomonilaceae bacterium]|nr:hypothetical protein [Desulfomonilaceae bacterium]
MSELNPTERLLERKELLEHTGISERALRTCEERGYVKAAKTSVFEAWYTTDVAKILKALMWCPGRCANLDEAYDMVARGMWSKIRQAADPNCGRSMIMDPRTIKRHPRFEELLGISEDSVGDLAADMGIFGYYETHPIALAVWPGQPEPVVADGHARLAAAIAGGIEPVWVVIKEFKDEHAVLEYIANVQTKRRPTDDAVLYRFIVALDKLMPCGGDRRREQAVDRPPDGGTTCGRSASARRTASIVGCNFRKVERVRKILKDGTDDIRDAVSDGKMTINRAYNTIVNKAKAKARRGDDNETHEKLSEEMRKAACLLFPQEDVTALERLGGNPLKRLGAALRGYLEQELRKRTACERVTSDAVPGNSVSSTEPGACPILIRTNLTATDH